METKEEGIKLALGYINLEDCIKGWGPKGRSMYDGLVRQSMNFHGYTNRYIHSPSKKEINERTNIQNMSNVGDVS